MQQRMEYVVLHQFQQQKIDKYKKQQQMQDFPYTVTPVKQSRGHNSIKFQSIESTGPRSNQLDYKAKTFKLMKQLAEAEVLNKKTNTQIRHLERDIESYKQDQQRVVSILGVNTYEQALKKLQYLTEAEQVSNRTKIEQWSNLVEQYKKIINAQQYKFIRQEQQLKISELRIKRLEQGQVSKKDDKASEQQGVGLDQSGVKEETKWKAGLQAKEEEVKSLKEELRLLKDEYKQILVDREHWKEQFQSLESKYALEIQHFEQMERHVEERLLQVEREMNFYRDERQAHLQKIELLKKQINYNEEKQYFSFGGVKHKEAQTDLPEENSPYNYECLEISIKTLLEQNCKLKNTLLVLYKRQPGEELPKDIELELKILLNMHDSNFRGTKEGVEGEKRRKEEKQWVEDRIEEAREEEENDEDTARTEEGPPLTSQQQTEENKEKASEKETSSKEDEIHEQSTKIVESDCPQ